MVDFKCCDKFNWYHYYLSMSEVFKQSFRINEKKCLGIFYRKKRFYKYTFIANKCVGEFDHDKTNESEMILILIVSV